MMEIIGVIVAIELLGVILLSVLMLIKINELCNKREGASLPQNSHMREAVPLNSVSNWGPQQPAAKVEKQNVSNQALNMQPVFNQPQNVQPVSSQSQKLQSVPNQPQNVQTVPNQAQNVQPVPNQAFNMQPAWENSPLDQSNSTMQNISAATMEQPESHKQAEGVVICRNCYQAVKANVSVCPHCQSPL